MKKSITFFFLFAVFLLFIAGELNAQFFIQSFDSALTAGNAGGGTIITNVRITDDPVYADSSGADSSQFTMLSNNNAADSIKLEGDGVMRLVRPGSGTIYIVRSTDFDGPPEAVQFSFDFNTEVNNANSGSAIQFMLGTNFSNSNSEPAATDKHSRFYINTKNTPSPNWGVTAESGSSPSAYSDRETVVWVVNNSGQALDYLAPDGSVETLGNDMFDVWVGETKEIDEAPAAAPAVDLTDFEIRIAGGNGIYTIDNLVVSELEAVGIPVTGDYGSVNTGNWSSLSTWAQWDGTGWNTAPASVPTGAVNVFINADDTVTVDAPDTVSSSLIVDGYLRDAGVLTATGINIFNDGSTYEFAHPSASGQGIPAATWKDGSTCLLTGITNSASGLNANQNFYNFIVDCPSWTGNLNFAWGGTSSSSPTTIDGDVIVRNTGTGRWQWAAPQAGTEMAHNSAAVTVNGNLVIDGSASDASNMVSVTAAGTSNPYVDITINILGNVTVTGNPVNTAWTNFSISRGSLGNLPDSGSSCTWNLYGDLTISDLTTQNSDTTGKQGKFVFAGSGIQNFTGSNVTFASRKVQFAVNAGSTLQLNSPMATYSLIINGRINSSEANPLILGYLEGDGDYQISDDEPIVGGGSDAFVNGPAGFLMVPAATQSYELPIGKDTVFRPLTLSVTHDVIDTTFYTAELFNSPPSARTLPSSLDKVSSIRHFRVTKSGDTNVTAASIRLSYDSDDGVTDPPNLRIAKDDGSGNWVDLGGTGTAAESGTITSTVNFTAFSDFVLANAAGGTNPVPVELISFSAYAEGKSVTLKWSTASELNNQGWEIERRIKNNENNSVFNKIGFIKGAGNSTSLNSYSYNDKNASAGVFQYRLRQIDYDGTFNYSEIVEADVTGPTEFALFQNYPNPFNPETVIKFDIPVTSFVNLSVYNTIGEKVETLVNQQMERGSYSWNFNAGNHSSGVYIYRLSAGDKVFTEKMMLIK